MLSWPVSPIRAVFGIAGGGAFTRVAIGMGTGELFFWWIGPLAAVALADWSTARNALISATSFVLGFLAVLWLAP